MEENNMKTLAAGTYNLAKTFVPAIGEIKNWNSRRNALLTHWKNFWNFTIIETDKDSFITIDTSTANYTALAAEVAPSATSTQGWVLESSLTDLTSAQSADLNAMLATKGLDSINTVYLSVDDIDDKLRSVQNTFYAKYNDTPIYVTKKTYTKSAS